MKSRDSLVNILKTNPPTGKSLEFIMTQIEGLTNSIESCENELKAITAPVAVPNKKEVEEEIRDLAGLFRKANYEQKRSILKILVKEMVLDPFNKCVVLYRFHVPQSTMLVTTKKASHIGEASTIKVHCGGRLCTRKYIIKYPFAA